MTVTKLAARLIRVFEGCKLTAYWDKTGKVWTIGYGHTKTAKQGMKITHDEAVRLLEQDMAILLRMVAGKPPLEAAALVSFGYNCGAGALRRLLDGEISIEKYGRTSGGVELPGLVARRELEAALVDVSRQSAHSFDRRPQ